MAFETHGDDFKPCASWLDAVWDYGWYGVEVKLDDAFSGAIDIDMTESVNGEKIWLTNQFSEKRRIEFKELKICTNYNDSMKTRLKSHWSVIDRLETLETFLYMIWK